MANAAALAGSAGAKLASRTVKASRGAHRGLIGWPSRRRGRGRPRAARATASTAWPTAAEVACACQRTARSSLASASITTASWSYEVAATSDVATSDDDPRRSSRPAGTRRHCPEPSGGSVSAHRAAAHGAAGTVTARRKARLWPSPEQTPARRRHHAVGSRQPDALAGGAPCVAEDGGVRVTLATVSRPPKGPWLVNPLTEWAGTTRGPTGDSGRRTLPAGGRDPRRRRSASGQGAAVRIVDGGRLFGHAE